MQDSTHSPSPLVWSYPWLKGESLMSQTFVRLWLIGEQLINQGGESGEQFSGFTGSVTHSFYLPDQAGRRLKGS